jgi:hypothetical protein
MFLDENHNHERFLTSHLLDSGRSIRPRQALVFDEIIRWHLAQNLKGDCDASYLDGVGFVGGDASRCDNVAPRQQLARISL